MDSLRHPPTRMRTDSSGHMAQEVMVVAITAAPRMMGIWKTCALPGPTCGHGCVCLYVIICIHIRRRGGAAQGQGLSHRPLGSRKQHPPDPPTHLLCEQPPEELVPAEGQQAHHEARERRGVHRAEERGAGVVVVVEVLGWL